MKPDLKRLQILLYRAITEGPDGGLGQDFLLRMIRGDERLSASERIAIYANAYFYRLLDCLRDDFPATAAVVGASAFEELARAYLRRYRPTEPSIFHVGRYFANFLAEHPLLARWPFLSELARLERTLIEVFHGPDAQPLSADELQEVPPERWPLIRMKLHPALRMLDCQWRVNDLRRAVESGGQCHEPMPGPIGLLVWRRGFEVYYRQLQAPERAALETASKGASFQSVCEAFASCFDDGEPAAAISRMLARWLEDEILVRVEPLLAD